MTVFVLRSRMGIKFRIDRELVKIGRAEDNTIVLRDPTVSRYHLNIYHRNGQLIVEDAGSQNGFLVNGNTPSGPTVVNLGDIIFFAGVEYRVESDQGLHSVRESGTSLMRPNAKVKYFGLALGLFFIVIFGKKTPQPVVDEKVASENSVDELPSIPLLPNGYKGDSYVAKSISEINSEGKFREGMRDYYNGNYSRAIVSFDEALAIDPAHQQASHYIRISEEQLKRQIEEFLQDAYQSFSAAQYRRAKSQGSQVLTILSEQVPGYVRRIASESTSLSQTEGQELTLLKLPCSNTRLEEVCNKSKEVINAARRKLGEEDTLRQ